jgi:DNA-binding NarL/FixJ family response regulator
MGVVHFRIHDAECEASLAVLRNAMDEKLFDATWAEGAALSIEDAITYAQRGRGERKRPASGWPSLTPAERDVARLVCEGLANKDIAARFSCLRGPCRPTSRTSTPSSASPPGCNWCSRRQARRQPSEGT